MLETQSDNSMVFRDERRILFSDRGLTKFIRMRFRFQSFLDWESESSQDAQSNGQGDWKKSIMRLRFEAF